MQFADFDPDSFLRDHWQKSPCLIRNPWTHWSNPLDPDDLAGLACEDEIDSRLVINKRGDWKLRHGPIPEKAFAKLGKHPWTLLVQGVDRYVPEVAALRTPFGFIPDWRIDDVMVSYASDGGGVGPHFDQYDVFLIQGLGTRRWQIGELCDAATPLLPHDDLRLLADFQPTEEWRLEPGDMLYIPPRIAHNGVAVGDDCMTYSIGFRAPSRADLITHYADYLLESLPEDDRYTDPDLTRAANPGEISAAALDRLHTMLTDTLTDRAAFARWFGSYTTIPKNPVDNAQADPTPTLTRNPASRFAFIRPTPDTLTLFVDGVAFDCTGETASFAEQLCTNTPLPPAPAAATPLINALLAQSSLIARVHR